jgi:prefoldin subunit 5
MAHPDKYEAFVRQLKRDTALLDKQYKAFDELKNTLEVLKTAAPHDPSAARNLEKVNALNNDANFQALCVQAEKDLRAISRQIDSLNKQTAQAEKSQDVPVEQSCSEGKGPRADPAKRPRSLKPKFV